MIQLGRRAGALPSTMASAVDTKRYTVPPDQHEGIDTFNVFAHQDKKTESGDKYGNPAIIACVVAVCVVLIILISLYVMYKRKKKNKSGCGGGGCDCVSSLLCYQHERWRF